MLAEQRRGAPSLPEIEAAVLELWQRGKIFERSIDERPASRAYVFYDGPPYATGLPHIGHLLASTAKDAVPRYMTMRGHRVERRFGWDCHGLPIEVLVEKELGLKTKKDIEMLGVQKFNDACRTTVLRYVQEWRRTITRFGRWVDFERDYKTMEPGYMESCWWAFSELYRKGLVYEDYRSSLYCTRCETPLSNFETAMDDSYDEVEDPSAYVAFAVAGSPNTYLLSWTTTPWTLSANVALAVNGDAEYVEAEVMEGDAPWVGRRLILAKGRLPAVLGEGHYVVRRTVPGSALVGRRYEPVQPLMAPAGEAYRVVAAPFVSVGEGTGIVHVAPAFGQDDFELAKQENLPVLLTVDDGGRFLPAIAPWAGQHVKAADPAIIEALRAEGKLFRAETIRHSYPFCWRCESPLIYKAQKSWYVKVAALKQKLLRENEKIRWVPEHLKHGRFQKGIESAPDWGVSRSRYWGVPLPVWRCDRCKKERVVGSLDELESLSGKRPHDLHRPLIDEVGWACGCGGTYTRRPEVFDVWFDSGAMPYGQVHYPFENKEKFEAEFPADFITEYVPQTRGWFYVMHVIAVALFGKPAFRNVLTTGTILAADGSKMSKSKGNAPDVHLILDRYGADALRLYLLASPVMQGEAINYDEAGIEEASRKVLLPLLNVFAFFKLYAPAKHLHPMRKPAHVLDRWVLARLEETRRDVEAAMDAYELSKALRPLTAFVTDLSTWYVRRSRGRFKSDDEADKTAALATLYSVLVTTTKVLAPFAPFLSEHLYQELKRWMAKPKDSVHLELWPRAHREFADDRLLQGMVLVREVVELGHARRSELKLKVRQPLAAVRVTGAPSVTHELQAVVLDELNVKRWVGTAGDGKFAVDLDATLSDDLRREGLKREFIRQVNALRKKEGLTINDTVTLRYATKSPTLQHLLAAEHDAVARAVLASSVEAGEGEHELKVDGEVITVTLVR